MSDFSRMLGALMNQHGVSAYELARQVPCDPSLISRYRNGRQKSSAKMAGRLDELLQADGALAAAAESTLPGRRAVLAGSMLIGGLLSIRPDALERLTWAEQHPPRIDAAAVESLGEVLAAQRRAEDALGSAAMLRPVLAQLNMVDEFARQVYGPLRRPLVNVGQQWAQFAGWLCRDVGDLTNARICYARALEWAAELGDVTMTATILVERSYMAADANEIGSMIGLAEAAQRDSRAAVEQRALASGLEARGYAMAGDSAATERKLDDAENLTGLVGSRELRPWSYWMTPSFFQNVAGFTCGFLAGATPRWHERAVTLLAARPQSDARALWAPAANLTHVAFAHAQAGDVDQACATAQAASAAARRTGSARHMTTLTRIHADLQARWPGHPRVTQLAEALR
jgi:transcriptional regulator with XRE-family HTH domain